MAAQRYFGLGVDGAVPMRGEDVPTVNRADDPAGYLPSDALRRAVDVALVIGRPLLLMGAPGTGKSELAHAVAHWFGCPLQRFDTKSTNEARDLFYTFDALSAFRARDDDQFEPRDYITFQALGRAILDAFPRDHPRVLDLIGPARSAAEAAHIPRRTVVLIDEIDKAPRDFPNDLLNEIERLYFRVPELHNALSPGGRDHPIPPNLRPIVIITSNDERGLPPAFLRRCAFFHINFPARADMEKIVAQRLRTALSLKAGDTALPRGMGELIGLFYDLRKANEGASEGPSTAELLDWAQALLWAGYDPARPLKEQAHLLPPTLSTVAKSADALERAKTVTVVAEAIAREQAIAGTPRAG